MYKVFKRLENGITLVALATTIIVLLILAALSIYFMGVRVILDLNGAHYNIYTGKGYNGNPYIVW